MRKTNMRGPKTLDGWLEAYEERAGEDARFVMSPGEKMVWSKDNGFFTWLIDPERKLLLIPKMMDNDKHWQALILKMILTIKDTGVDKVLVCSRRRPKVYLRVHGGELYKMEAHFNFQTKESSQLWWYIISLKDTKEKEVNPIE